MSKFIIILIVLMFFSFAGTYSAKILFLDPQVGKSHSDFMNRAAEILVEAGHDVTTLIMPMEKGLDAGIKLGKTITMEKSEKAKEASNRLGKVRSTSLWTQEIGNPIHFVKLTFFFQDIRKEGCQNVVDNETLTEFVRTQQFELAIVHSNDYCGLGLIKLYKIKVHLTLYAGGTLPNHYQFYGLTFPVAQVPIITSDYADTEMGFINRIKNVINYFLTSQLTNRGISVITEIFEKKYGKGFIDISKQISDATFHISNSDPYLSFSHPLLHKIVEIGGFSIRNHKALDSKWNEILNKRKHNILISYGSNAKSINMPIQMRNSFLAAFKRFTNVTFIWKYETPSDGTAKNLDNVHLVEWLPQNDLLNDGRIHIFVTHGGLNSIHESAHAGVKLLVTPLFGDQKHNAKVVSEKVKIGITLTKEDVGVPEKLFDGLTKLMEEDSKISRNSFQLKEMIKNRPYNNKEVFIKTVDFAAKFGKLNLNMEEQDMPLYKYLLLDIILIIVLFPFVVIGLLYLLF